MKQKTAIDLFPNRLNLQKLAYLSPLTLRKVHKLTLQKKGGGDYKREAYQFESAQSGKLYNFMMPFEDTSRNKTPFEIWDFVAKVSALIDIDGWDKVIQADKQTNNITGQLEYLWTTPRDKSR